MLLEAKGIVKRFGGSQVLTDVWIEAEAASITGLIGPNGAGKSTFLAVLSKFLDPEAGTIVCRGENTTRSRPHEIARKGMVRTFQVPREFGRLTVLENLLVAPTNQIGESVFGAWLRGSRVAAQERQLVRQADDVIDFLKLSEVRDVPAGKLSGGQKKLLELGRALMLDPLVLLLDEPFAGVNPALIDEIIERLFALKERGLCLIVVEHNMYAIRTLCDVIFVMVDGRILTNGTPAEVFQDTRVLDAYLGREHGRTA
jgi:ABC-type branched-subunit amino acid transport system ATPase component